MWIVVFFSAFALSPSSVSRVGRIPWRTECAAPLNANGNSDFICGFSEPSPQPNGIER